MKLLMLVILLFSLKASWARSMSLVSTSPAITETLIDLQASRLLVGVSPYCKDVVNKKNVGTSLRPLWENIVGLKPNYVLFQGDGVGVNFKRAKKLSLNPVFLQFNRIEDIQSSLKRLSQLTGKSDHLLQKRLSQVRDKISTLKKKGRSKRVLVVVSFKSKLGHVTSALVVGKENHFDDLFQLAGAQNVANHKGYQDYSVEKIRKLKFDELHYLPYEYNQRNERRLIAFKNKWLTGEKVVSWNHKYTQNVGTKFIHFMEAFYERQSQ